MIQKWDIQLSPTGKNKERHKLLIMGDMKDVFFIVKKLGSVCSRPEKTKGDFNFAIYLSKMDTNIMAKLKDVTGELAKIKETPLDSKTPPPILTTKKEEAKPYLAEPAMSDKSAVVDRPIEKEKPVVDMSAPKKEEKIMQAELKEDEKPVSPFETMRRMSIPSRKDRQRTEKVEEKPISDEVKAKAAVEREKIISTRRKILGAKWPVELPIIPTHNFEKLVAGSHNRFAHAASMAVIESPGLMYNPLLIFGTSGTGKTHFSHAIAYGLANKLGHQNIFVTDGMKLSKGIELAAKDGLIGKFEEMFSHIKALVIDDVHLLMIGEKNKEFLSKLMNDFLKQDKQLVATSLFPPKALSGLEDHLGFQLTQGWMVDLKVPNADNYKTIIMNMVDSVNLKLSMDSVEKFFMRETLALGDVLETLIQVKKLEKLIVNENNELSHEELLGMLMINSPEDGGVLMEEELEKAAAFKFGGEDNWFKWGLFYPQGMAKEAKWVLCNLHERAKDIGFNMQWNQVFMEEYNPDESYGTPFKIGEYSSNKKINGVIILGPQSGSALGPQELEFKRLTKKILSSFSVKCGWIGLNRFRDSTAYTKILMDLV